MLFYAEAARELAEEQKPKCMLDAENMLTNILEAITDVASRGDFTYIVDLTSQVRSYYPNYQYWYLEHNPFRIYLTKLLRNLGFTVKYHADYSSWPSIYGIATPTIFLRISWWRKDSNKKSKIACGCCNNTCCKGA